ncbi:MAG: hypothetical protein KJ718_06445 [Nanoarchaeota archaeon]|nr:hypothetical protein [Nanoarchaeota archaeon]MBU1052157.1 hypothetical protein [Nanoarchaeota archaeon]MBU1988124.1 hypothetical protein [Nanoarchaeota archaeon]
MLNQETIKKIEQFVCSKPRSIQEIALHINKNWRTADRYVSEIEKEFGTIATRVFRGGTRGALKIAFWASVEKASNSAFQEQLEKQIIRGRTKFEFSPFDIFQHIPDNKKDARIEHGKDETTTTLEDLKNFLQQAKKQLLIFSGNLSFINFKNEAINIFSIIEELGKKGVSMKVLSRVDIAGKDNIDKLLSLNFKQGKENIEIRHSEQPLRAVVVDNKLFRMKEIKESTGRKNELGEKTFIFYTIKDKEWAEWLSKIFWKMFSSSIGSSRRLTEMKKFHS